MHLKLLYLGIKLSGYDVYSSGSRLRFGHPCGVREQPGIFLEPIDIPSGANVKILLCMSVIRKA